MTYYADKLDLLRDVFAGRRIELLPDALRVDRKRYPIIDDVIVVLEPEHYPPSVLQKLRPAIDDMVSGPDFARDIQFTFGEEWRTFPDVMREHQAEFHRYFDLVDLADLSGKRVCDLGCGIGRWSHFLRQYAGELILIDFSDAIFIARDNLRQSANTVFLMGDLRRLPLRPGFADLVCCIGVLHHLPAPALQVVRELRRYAPRLLIYLYSALDGRPPHYRLLLPLVSAIRGVLSRTRNARVRSAFTWMGAICIYMPFIALGHLLRPVGLARYAPLFDFYHAKSMKRIRQDVYDRFFTRIEQRFSRAEILTLTDSFARVSISPDIPMWHFLCERD